MKKIYLKITLALAVLSQGVAAVPAQAVEIAFSGGSNTTSNPNTVIGTDGIGDPWQTQNGSLPVNSNFAMADFNTTPQTFNPSNFSNDLGTYATSFQLKVNNSPFGVGFEGIGLGPVSSGLVNHFTVKPDVLDPSSWITWDTTYNLLDSVSGFYQQVLFTAPVGTQLTQGTNFNVDVNFAGAMTNDSGWVALFDDRAPLSLLPSAVVSEPGSIYLLGLGLLGLVAGYRRKHS